MIDKCLRNCVSSENPRISPLTEECKRPHQSLFIIVHVLKTNQKLKPLSIFHAHQSMAITCVEHSFFPQSTNGQTTPHSQVQKCSFQLPPPGQCTSRRWTSQLKQKSNYELFNRNNLNIHFWSWNYRGCWHQTCPPIDNCSSSYVQLIPIRRHGCPVLLCLVTTSPIGDWAICAPAAFLRCGSHS